MAERLRIRGRDIGPAELALIRGWLGLHPPWSRRRLSEALAAGWDWRTPTGQLKDIAARDLLNRLAVRGLIHLPPRQRRGGRQIPRALGSLAPEVGMARGSLVPRCLKDVQPLCWPQAPAGPAERAQVARYLQAYHYLGYPDPLGQLHYLVRDCQGQAVACLLFGPAAWKVAARDEFIGWSGPQRQRRLGHLANHSRLLILPWVHIPCLASHLLAQAVQRLRVKWHEQARRCCSWSVGSTIVQAAITAPTWAL